MTIQKNSAYGVPALRPSNLIILDNDRDIAVHFASDTKEEHFTVMKGSIAQSLGIGNGITQPIASSDQQMTLVRIDLLQIDYRTKTSVDAVTRLVVAGTLSIQHRTSLSTTLILSNSVILQKRDVLPRAHPNDGFVDVLEIDPKISTRQRIIAWHRSVTGSHLPHPSFRVGRSRDFEWSGRPSKMIADGVAVKGVVWLQCKVLPDAMSIYF
jgi:hypothetical protein